MINQPVPNFIVIDDDPVNNIVCSKIIKHTYPQADIKTFDDPDEGLHYLQSEHVESTAANTILYLDINMPTISGWDFLRAFEKLRPSVKEQLQIYMLSSSIDPLDKVRSTSNKNVYDYIGKPLTRHAVEETVNKLHEENRSALSREIHDELGQQLMRIKMDIAWLSSKITDPDEIVLGKIAGALALVDDTVETIRRINTGLRPRIIDDLGLFAAIEWHATEIAKHSGIRCTVAIGFTEPEFSKLVSGNVFRIYQEALTNAGKYSKATSIETTINYTEGNLIMTIEDNGIGFSPKIKGKPTFGLLGMKERSAVINGSLKIISRPGKGTRIQLTVPLII